MLSSLLVSKSPKEGWGAGGLVNYMQKGNLETEVFRLSDMVLNGGGGGGGWPVSLPFYF